MRSLELEEHLIWVHAVTNAEDLSEADLRIEHEIEHSQNPAVDHRESDLSLSPT